MPVTREEVIPPPPAEIWKRKFGVGIGQKSEFYWPMAFKTFKIYACDAEINW